MHQSTTPSLSQTIWPRWGSRQFLSLPIVQTLLPVTLAYSLSSEAVVMRQLRRWKTLLQRSLTRSHKRTSMGLFIVFYIYIYKGDILAVSYCFDKLAQRSQNFPFVCFFLVSLNEFLCVDEIRIVWNMKNPLL